MGQRSRFHRLFLFAKASGSFRLVGRLTEVIDEVKKEGKTVHLAQLMDICHLENSELEPKKQKYKGRVVIRGDIVKRLCGLLRSMHRARFVCFTNDGCKSNGCQSKATRMRRTSSGRRISVHTGQNGRCTITVENSNKVRKSRYLDTSSKTQIG